MIRTILIAALAASLGGCAISGALEGNATDCASAQAQLSQAQSALGVAQVALDAAQAVGLPIAPPQAAVNTITGDIASITALVRTKCAVPALAPAVAFRADAPTITLDKAKKLAARDKRLAEDVKDPK